MPSVLESIMFVALLAIVVMFGATFLYHLFFAPPFVPTPAAVVDEMIRQARLAEGRVVYDLGAGDARFLIEAKRACPGVLARGSESATLVWLLGKLRIALAGVPIDWRCCSYNHQSVTDADVIFLYLFPSAMAALEPRFDKELKPGTRVISHSFRFPTRKPVKEVEVGKRMVLVYEW